MSSDLCLMGHESDWAQRYGCLLWQKSIPSKVKTFVNFICLYWFHVSIITYTCKPGDVGEQNLTKPSSESSSVLRSTPIKPQQPCHGRGFGKRGGPPDSNMDSWCMDKHLWHHVWTILFHPLLWYHTNHSGSQTPRCFDHIFKWLVVG